MKIYSFGISKTMVLVTLATTTLVHAANNNNPSNNKNLRGGRLLGKGSNSCSGPNQECKGNEGTIGDEACQGEWDDEPSTVYGVCMRNSGSIGPWACSGYGKNCYGNTGVIEASACTGKDACLYNHNPNLDSSIGPASCIGTNTCRHNAGSIGMGACMGDNSCPNNQGIIEPFCCNQDNYIDECDSNTGIIAKIPGQDQCQHSDRPKSKTGEKCNSRSDCLGGYECAKDPDDVGGPWVCCSGKGVKHNILTQGSWPHCRK